MNLPLRGEIIGADFSEPGRLIVHVALDLEWEAIAKARVVLEDEREFDLRLPSVEDVKGILG